MYKEKDFVTIDKDSLLKTEYYNIPIFKIKKIDNLNREITVESNIGNETILNIKNILPIEMDSNLAKKIELDYAIMASILPFDSHKEIPPIANKQEYFKDTLNNITFTGPIEPVDISKCKYVHEVQEILRKRPELDFKLKYMF